MKKLLKLLGVLAVVVILLGIAMAVEFSRTDRIISATEVDPAQTALALASLPDGRYEGSFTPGKFVGASVAVVVKDHVILDIVILEHNYGQGKPAERITQQVISSQGLAVDSISGATVSSKVILLAIENAIRRR